MGCERADDHREQIRGNDGDENDKPGRHGVTESLRRRPGHGTRMDGTGKRVGCKRGTALSTPPMGRWHVAPPTWASGNGTRPWKIGRWASGIILLGYFSCV